MCIRVYLYTTSNIYLQPLSFFSYFEYPLVAPGWHSQLSTRLLVSAQVTIQGPDIEPCFSLSTESA